MRIQMSGMTWRPSSIMWSQRYADAAQVVPALNYRIQAYACCLLACLRTPCIIPGQRGVVHDSSAQSTLSRGTACLSWACAFGTPVGV